jgi:hypothetical protein
MMILAGVAGNSGKLSNTEVSKNKAPRRVQLKSLMDSRFLIVQYNLTFFYNSQQQLMLQIYNALCHRAGLMKSLKK